MKTPKLTYFLVFFPYLVHLIQSHGTFRLYNKKRNFLDLNGLSYSRNWNKTIVNQNRKTHRNTVSIWFPSIYSICMQIQMPVLKVWQEKTYWNNGYEDLTIKTNVQWTKSPNRSEFKSYIYDSQIQISLTIDSMLWTKFSSFNGRHLLTHWTLRIRVQVLKYLIEKQIFTTFSFANGNRSGNKKSHKSLSLHLISIILLFLETKSTLLHLGHPKG